jgi:hypothetical protein
VLPAAALLIRPDRDDAEYLELATRYGSSLALGAAGGEGVLIAPRWVLTSAQAAKSLQQAKDARVRRYFLHPEADLALLLLNEASTMATGVIYRRNDEAGKGVAVVGFGSRDRRARAGINTVDRVTPTTLGLRIKPLAEASDLQAERTPSEIGGPAYIEVEGAIFVAGIASGVQGGWENYVRVSAFAAWIDETMLAAAMQEANTAPARKRK